MADAWRDNQPLVWQFAQWLWGAWAQLGHYGVATTAWLAGWFLWWAVLPARLAWWGVLFAGRAATAAWQGLLWAAEMVAVPHDDRLV